MDVLGHAQASCAQHSKKRTLQAWLKTEEEHCSATIAYLVTSRIACRRRLYLRKEDLPYSKLKLFTGDLRTKGNLASYLLHPVLLALLS